ESSDADLSRHPKKVKRRPLKARPASRCRVMRKLPAQFVALSIFFFAASPASPILSPASRAFSFVHSAAFPAASPALCPAFFTASPAASPASLILSLTLSAIGNSCGKEDRLSDDRGSKWYA